MPMKHENKRFVNEPEAKPESEDYEIKFRKHPIYDLYFGSKCGKYININKKVINCGVKQRNGYRQCMIRARNGRQKTYLSSSVCL